MPHQFVREICYYKSYYLDYFKTLTPSTQEKFNWVLQLIATTDRIPEKYLKHLTGTDGLYEIRIEHSSNTYRIFCFFDSGRLIILLQGFQKKTGKTPKEQILRAEKLRNDYFHEKDQL